MRRLFGNLREGLRVEGIMPERALLRLKRAGISIYNAQKTKKNVILFRVKKKDIEKVFAIYPKVCYNNSTDSLYRVTKTGGIGLAKVVNFLKKRTGVVLGILLFCATTLAADNLVLGVQFVGSKVYSREAVQALEENGIKSFAFYPAGKEPLVTAKLLTLNGVEFCSVKKVGYWVRVETHIDPFTTDHLQKSCLKALRQGEILSLTVLRGTALKKVGDGVYAGENIVGNWFLKEDGERITVEPIARVQLACEYAQTHTQANSEEEAFAQAYLALGLLDGDKITERKITQTEEGFFVEMKYCITQKVNF